MHELQPIIVQFRNENWEWIDLDPRESEIEFKISETLDLTSKTFERSVMTMNLDGYVRNVISKEPVAVIGCQYNLRI